MKKIAVVLVLSALVAAVAAKGGCDCWGLTPTRCLLTSGCDVCNFYGRKELCVWGKIADFIPSFVANCTASPVPDEPEAPSCDGLAAQEPCNAVDGCVWCVSAAVQPACYRVEEAKLLPPAVFECDAETELAVVRHRRDIV